MPGPARPKQFVAATNFIYAHRRYRVGDPIEDRMVIARLLARNSDAIRSVKPAPAEPPADHSAATPQAESPKED